MKARKARMYLNALKNLMLSSRIETGSAEKAAGEQ